MLTRYTSPPPSAAAGSCTAETLGRAGRHFHPHPATIPTTPPLRTSVTAGGCGSVPPPTPYGRGDRGWGWRQPRDLVPLPESRQTAAVATPPLGPSPPGRPVATGTAVPRTAVPLRSCSTVVTDSHGPPSVRTHRRRPAAPETTGHGGAGGRHRRGRVSANPTPFLSLNCLVQRQTAGVCAPGWRAHSVRELGTSLSRAIRRARPKWCGRIARADRCSSLDCLTRPPKSQGKNEKGALCLGGPQEGHAPLWGAQNC